MEIVAKEQRCGKSVTLYFSIIYEHSHSIEKVSDVYNIDDSAEVRFKCKPYGYDINTFLSLRKHASATDSTVKLEINSEVLNYSQQWTCTEHWIDWQQMGKKISYDCRVDKALKVILININVNESKSYTAEHIYQDSDWTDFILSTTDGCIAVHRACLAAYSDVFKTMLSQEWKETTEGRLQIEGVTLQTLQHLKQYMYLGTLPDDGLRPLLLLAMCYLIDRLKSACISKLARTVTSEKLDDLLEFAVENKILELISAILQVTPDRVVHEAYQIKKKEEKSNNAESIEKDE